MTRSRLTYAALIAGLFVLHVMLVDYISYYVFIFFALLPCVSLLITVAFCRDSVVELRLAQSAGTVAVRGNPVTLELRADNPSFMQVRTRIDIAIRNELTRDEMTETVIVPAGRGGVIEQSVSSGCPGRVTFRVTGIGVYDPLGLFCFKTKRRSDSETGILIFPETSPVAGVTRNNPVPRDVENDGLMQVVKGDDPSELYDIREYRSGDLISRIHWKLSQRSGHLMVKELGRVVCGDALIMLDLNGGSAEADALLGALASVSAHLSQAGESHDIEWYSARSERVVRSHVESEGDGADALSSVLRDGGLQEGPYVLRAKSGGAGRSPYSKVIYICSAAGMDDGGLWALAASARDSEVSVLIVSADGEAAAAAKRGAPPDLRILHAAPSDAAAVLMGTEL